MFKIIQQLYKCHSLITQSKPLAHPIRELKKNDMFIYFTQAKEDNLYLPCTIICKYDCEQPVKLAMNVYYVEVHSKLASVKHDFPLQLAIGSGKTTAI